MVQALMTQKQNNGREENQMSDTQVYGYAEIEQLIPHRSPFLLIDRLEDVVLGESATGIKAVSGNEPYFVGHFPGNPVMPGVLIVEAMAQAASCMATLTFPDKQKDMLVFLASVDKTRFKTPVCPGDLLKLKVMKTAGKGALWKFSGTAEVEGKIVAQAEFSAMVVEKNR